jgi:streptogramin lyase
VQFPISYTYEAASAARILTPVAGYSSVWRTLANLDIPQTSSNKYLGGVLAPNGHIYMVPYNADNIGDFDPSTGFSNVDISGVISYDGKYRGGVLAPNGHIYIVPCNADNIDDFDPSTGAFSVIDISSVITHSYKYIGGVLAPNGHIYMVPSNANSIGDFDPSTGAFSVIDISSVISHRQVRRRCAGAKRSHLHGSPRCQRYWRL